MRSRPQDLRNGAQLPPVQFRPIKADYDYEHEHEHEETRTGRKGTVYPSAFRARARARNRNRLFRGSQMTKEAPLRRPVSPGDVRMCLYGRL